LQDIQKNKIGKKGAKELTLEYISDFLTKEQYLEKVFNKSNSYSSLSVSKEFITMFEKYCEYGLKIDSEIVISDLVKDWKKSNSPEKCTSLLRQFFEWLTVDHKDIVIRRGRIDKKTGLAGIVKDGYFKAKSPARLPAIIGAVRLYLRARTNIRITAEDVKDKISYPVVQTERIEIPLTLDQFTAIYDKTTLLVRKAKYLFERDTGVRGLEALKITKDLISFNHDKTGIAKVFIPKKIVKAKTKSRIAFLTSQTANIVYEISKNKKEHDQIFNDRNYSYEELENVRNSELQAFAYARNSLIDRYAIFGEKHETGSPKISQHSIRAFTASAYSKGNGNNEALGHGYIGHKKYLEQYIRRSEAEQLEMFKKAIPYLTGITKEYGPDEISQRQKGLENQVNLLQRQLSEEKKNSIQAVKTKVNNSSKFEFVVKYLISENRLSLEELADLMSKAPKETTAELKQ